MKHADEQWRPARYAFVYNLCKEGIGLTLGLVYFELQFK
jgi:hypothetical protein